VHGVATVGQHRDRRVTEAQIGIDGGEAHAGRRDVAREASCRATLLVQRDEQLTTPAVARPPTSPASMNVMNAQRRRSGEITLK
jgi:hypothetical protein